MNKLIKNGVAGLLAAVLTFNLAGAPVFADEIADEIASETSIAVEETVDIAYDAMEPETEVLVEVAAAAEEAEMSGDAEGTAETDSAETEPSSVEDAEEAEDARQADGAEDAEETEETEKAEDAEEAGDAERADGAEDAEAAEETQAAEDAEEAEDAERADEAGDAEAAEETEETEDAEEAEDTERADEAGDAEAADAVEEAETPDETEQTEDAEETVEEVRYPSASFNGTCGDVYVIARAGEGVFPEGTEMRLAPVAAESVIAAAQNTVGEGSKVVDAVAVDITFWYDGAEIQPRDAASVNVSLFPTRALEGESFMAVTVNDACTDAQPVGAASAGFSSFATNHFTIYAIASAAPCATYEFYVGGTLLVSQRLAKGETITLPVPENAPDGQVFLDWTYEDGSAFTLTENQATNVTVKLHAEFGTVYTATFWTENGSQKVKTVSGKAGTVVDVSASSVNYLVDPQDRGKVVVGWVTDLDSKTPLTTFTLTGETGNVDFYPIIGEGYWLFFDTEGGTNVEPRFVTSQSISEQDAAGPRTSRGGYDFVEWYVTGDAEKAPFNFNDSASYGSASKNGEIRLTAEWEQVISYSIVYHLEKLDDNGKVHTTDGTHTPEYAVYKSDVVRDEAFINEGKTDYASFLAAMDESDKQFLTGFSLVASDDDTAIDPAGSTTINLYYARNSYTFSFDTAKYGENPNYSFSAYFGENVADLWPSSVPGLKDTYPQETWKLVTGDEKETLHTRVVQMPAENRSYTEYDEGGANTYVRRIFLQCLPGETSAYSMTASNGSVLYFDYMQEYTVVVKSSAIRWSASGVYNRLQPSARLSFYGFSLDEVLSIGTDTNPSIEKYDPFDTKSGTLDKNEGYSGEGGRKNLYYTRNQHNLILVSGNGVTEIPVYYDQMISAALEDVGFNFLNPQTPAGFEGYDFKGWFDEAGKQFEFGTKMPDNELKAIARWEQKKDLTVTFWNGDSKINDFTVNGGETIDPSKVEKPTSANGAEFGGWESVIKGQSSRQPFSLEMRITDSMDVYATWLAPGSKNGTIRLAYDLGSNEARNAEVTDNARYVDGAQAVISSASLMPYTIDGVTYYFTGWTVKGTQKLYRPGSTILLRLNDAEKDASAENSFVITLVANYSDMRTLVTFYPIPGDESTVITKPVALNDAEHPLDLSTVSVTEREGYHFAGWTTQKGGSTVEYAKNAKIMANNVDLPNALYGVWTELTNLGDAEVTLSSSSYTYTGTERTVAVTSVRINGVEVSKDSYEVDGTTSGTDAGTYILSIVPKNDTQYFGNSTQFWRINPAELTVTTGSGEKPYDGSALTNSTVTVDGLQNGETVTVTATGSQTDVGSSDNTYSITWGTAKESNYNVTPHLGKLEVKENNVAAITLTAASASKPYDGTELTNPTVLTGGLPDGFTVSATASGSQTDAGSSVNTVNDGYVIRDRSGKDVTPYFTNVTRNPGTLTVIKATANPVTVAIEGWSYGDAAKNPVANAKFGTPVITYSSAENGTYTGAVPSARGTYYVKAAVEETGNYVGGEAKASFTITARPLTITADSDSKTYDGTALSKNSYSITSGTPVTGDKITNVTVTGSQTDAGSSSNTPSAAVIKNGGTDVTANYAITYAPGTLTVNKKAVTVTTGSASKAYDGKPLTCADETKIEGLVEGETATVETTGSQTEVGSSSNGYVIRWGTAREDNYTDNTVTDRLGTLTVTGNNAEIVITAASDEKEYDGKALSKDDFTVTGLPEGLSVIAHTEGSRTDAGTSDNVVADGWKVLNAAGTDVTANFSGIRTENGTLKVNPKTVTVRTGSDTKAYDGTALTNAEASIEGLVDGESVTLTASGSITNVGDTRNTYNIVWDNATAGNYTVNEELGTLVVTASKRTVVLTAASATRSYDGTALTNSAVSFGGLPEGFTVEASASGSQTGVGSSANVVNDGYVIKDANGNNRTAYFTDIQKVNGTLEVTPKVVAITTGSASKAYDGTALTNAEASIEGLANGETATVTATGTITEVGTATNSYEIEWGTANAANYKVEEQLGALEITPNYTRITLTAASETRSYNGTALTNASVTSDGLPEGFTVEATVNGSQTAVGKSENSIVHWTIKDAGGRNVTNLFGNVVPVPGTLEVTPATVTVTTGSASKAYDGTALNGAGASIEGLVNGETATVTATGSITNVGNTTNSYAIVWGTADPANYTVKENLGTLTVTFNTEMRFTVTPAEAVKEYTGAEQTGDAVIAFGLPEGFTVEASVYGGGKDVGTYPTWCSTPKVFDAQGQDVTSNFPSPEYRDGTLRIVPKTATVITGSAEKTYDGTPLTNTEARIEGLLDGDAVTVTGTGSIIDVGTAENSYSIAWGSTAAENYTIKEQLGTLTVRSSDRKITLTADDATKTYDGTALAGSGVHAAGLPDGFTVEATFGGWQRDVGSSPVTVSSYIIRDANGNDKTANFANVQKVPGTLTVTKRTFTITTGSASKPYDGTALTNAEVKVSGLVAGETITVVARGSISEFGSTDNTCEILGWNNTNPSNYEVVEALGKLTITENNGAVVLTAASGSKTYDGKALTNSAVTAEGLPAGFTAAATATGEQINAGSSDNVVAEDYVIRNAKGEDVTKLFTNVRAVKGTLKVEPRPLTITADSASKSYDGEALTRESFTSTGLVNGDAVASVIITGSRTDAGSSDNIPSAAVITNGEADVTGNYAIAYAPGTLTVNPAAENAVTVSLEGWTYGDTANEPSYTADFGTAVFTYSDAEDGIFTETVPGTAGDWFVKATVAATENYAGGEATASFTIAKRAITVTVTGNSASLYYNGQEQKVEGFTFTSDFAPYTEDDFTFAGEAVAAGTAVGTYTMEITESDFANVNPNLDAAFVVIPGSLNIYRPWAPDDNTPATVIPSDPGDPGDPGHPDQNKPNLPSENDGGEDVSGGDGEIDLTDLEDEEVPLTVLPQTRPVPVDNTAADDEVPVEIEEEQIPLSVKPAGLPVAAGNDKTDETANVYDLFNLPVPQISSAEYQLSNYLLWVVPVLIAAGIGLVVLLRKRMLDEDKDR